ncbi:hypothetical protein ACFL5G_04465 [Candidatus Margulisiibacteriota bacterium]
MITNIFSILNVSLVIVLGVVTSYSDIVLKKVYNNALQRYFFIGVLIFIIFLGISLAGQAKGMYNLFYFRDVLINAFTAFLVAIIFWYLHVWAAADAKLFAVYAFLLPLSFYANQYLKYFPSFLLLLNIFMPALLYLLFKFTLFLIGEIMVSKKKYLQRLKKNISAHRKVWLSNILGYLAIFIITGILQKYINLALGKYFPIQGLAFMSLFFVRKILTRLLQSKAVPYIFALVSIFTITIDIFYEKLGWVELFISSLYLTIAFFVIYYGFKYLFDNYIDKREIVPIPLAELKENMLLSDTFMVLLKRDKKYFNKYIHRLYPDGLTKDQVAPVRKWLKDGGNKQAEIYKTFPFAPFVFTGVLITIIFKGSPFLKLTVELFKGIDVNLGFHLFTLF